MLGTRAILAGLIAILVIGNAGAQSKRRPTHTQQPIRGPSGNPAQPSTPDQRGTDQIPLTVKVLPSEGTKDKTEKEDRERAEQAGINKKLADETERLANETQTLGWYTGKLAIFTLLLFFAAVGQIWLFVWQLRLIRKGIDLTKDEFISTHRPRIILRDVCKGQGGEILYMLVNSGGSKATIMESWIIAEVVPPDQSRNLRSYGHDDLGRLTFTGGEMKDLTYPVPREIGLYTIGHSVPRIGEENWNSYFAGAILYSDAAGNRRRSVFRRRWDHGRQGFYRTDDPDQEYAD